MDNPQIRERVEEILARMTLEEKAAQMVQVPCAMVSEEEAEMWARRGAGSFLHTLGDHARHLQKICTGTRLGIPAVFGIDAIHGHGLNEHATIFPTQLSAACSWNRETVYAMGRATAREVAADGLHWTFSPVLCLARDPRWGRVNETFGEDPYLAGELGAQLIRGYQGDDLADRDSILACAKHYIAYGEATGARDSVDSEVTFRKVREVFLPPFAKAVEAGCATVMTAYGSLDGTSCTVSKKLLTDILRDELGFEGFVVTDWDNVQSLKDKQHVCETLEEASRLAAEAGNDLIMTSLGFYDAAIRAVRSGEMDESVLDNAVRRILTVKLRMGLFEHPDKLGDPQNIGCEAHLSLARQMADESLVLLRNDGMLPLAAKRIAVIGANADDLPAQYGDWTYFTHPLPDPEHAWMRPYATVKEGMEALGAKHGAQVRYAKGCCVLPGEEDEALMAEAMALAAESDAIVYVVGDVYAQVGETKDRADLTLSGRQIELYEKLAGLGKPVCVVLVASKPLCMGRMAEEANALIAAFNGGMFGGEAVARAIFGEINPSGHLPISFPRHSGQLPVYYNALPGWHGDRYNDMDKTPQFAFGEGMSYTTFELADFAFDSGTLTAGVTVRNTGERDGATVVQAYYNDVYSSVITPVKQLCAFERVALPAGGERRVTFAFTPEDFALVTPDERRVTEPGLFEIMVGLSSRDEDLLRETFRI